MAGRYRRKYTKNEEFEEGEVWGVIEGKKEMINTSFFTTSSSSPRKITTPKMITKSSSSEIFTAAKKQSSAPLNIPDWSKIYGKKTNNSNNNSNSNSNNNGNDNCSYDGYYLNSYNNDYNGYDGNCNDECGDGDGDGDDEMDGMVPPHEYIARKLARNQISSFSVYEGIGRTLKGRDLSKVRNAILSKTGFLE
ncbi:hypothetical protein RND81_06G135300 [Saponaria officinalis]|uniref:Uncharacterized protein n=1 Tax=Saponaria officinalis TaxID=3572 RepID=A0AAW1K9H6_SAPOF